MKSSVRPSNAVNFSPRRFISPWFFFGLMILLETENVKSLGIRQLMKSPEEQKLSGLKTCDFALELKDYSVSDLLRCTDDLAANSLPPMTQEFPNRLKTLQKSFSQSSGRQGYGLAESPYGQRPDPPFYRPGGSNLDEFYGNQGPYDPSESFGSGLVEALDSISQYDDLKCVPRLLCEIATGSKPGDGEYKASTFGDFGKKTLLGLLASYNFEETSPLLAFGKAALLGYSSKGDPSICYDEYVRCPTNPRDLVHYLNNHNGGFFRFFKNARGNPVPQGSNRVGFSRKAPAPPPGLSGPESDRTGTGELKFDTPESSARQDGKKIVFRLANDDSSKVVFPDEETSRVRQENPSLNRATKSLKFGDAAGFFPHSLENDDSRIAEPSFFPSDDEESQNINVIFQSGEDSREDDYHSYVREGRLLQADDHEKGQSSVITFPAENREERVSNFYTGVSKLFPLD